ncbi:MAG: ABC transporter ATP-binding protein [Rhizobacter sp.]
MMAIDVQSLRRTYRARGKGKDIVGLDDVSLQIGAGEVHGLLGPNGAGKTTLVKVLSTILLPSSGQVSVLGHDVVRDSKKVRGVIGLLLGGDKGIYNKLSGRQNLEYWAALYDVPYRETKKRVDTLVERVGLGDKAEAKAETYSRGTKQRLHLARALIGNAPILFFDEPTMGMDPLAARDFRKLIGELKAEGKTLLLTTHDMTEAEIVCDRVTLIDKGKVLAVETPQSLCKLLATHEWVDFETDANTLAQLSTLLDAKFPITPRATSGYRIQLKDVADAGHVLNLLVSHGVRSIQTTKPSLEEAYVHIVGDRGMRV